MPANKTASELCKSDMDRPSQEGFVRFEVCIATALTFLYISQACAASEEPVLQSGLQMLLPCT